MGSKIKYTENSKEVRRYLEAKGFKGLSFFQGGGYIYAFLSQWANIHTEWKTKEYSTIDAEELKYREYFENSPCSVEDFKIEVSNLLTQI